MTNCKEYRDDVLDITAIPLADLATGTSEWQLKPVINGDSFRPVLTNAITIGVKPATAGGSLIPIRRSSGKAKDTETDGVPGRIHAVTVNCDVDDRDSGVPEGLLTLERTPSHLLLTYRDHTQAFVAATEDTYICEVERDGGKVSVSFRIQNLAGIQAIIA